MTDPDEELAELWLDGRARNVAAPRVLAILSKESAQDRDVERLGVWIIGL